MVKSRYASAIGIAVALGELHDAEVEEALDSEHAWSAKASCSSGAELEEDCHILPLAFSAISNSSASRLRAIPKPMADAVDASAVLGLLDQVKKYHGTVVQMFVKAEADPRGQVRGMRHSMNSDSGIHNTRHARAAVGGFIEGLVSDTQRREDRDH